MKHHLGLFFIFNVFDTSTAHTETHGQGEAFMEPALLLNKIVMVTKTTEGSKLLRIEGDQDGTVRVATFCNCSLTLIWSEQAREEEVQKGY